MSIVLQLQEQALQPNADIGNLLHKALVVASKLGLKKFEKWVRLELGGYTTGKVPDYRKVSGTLHARTAHWDMPANAPTGELQDKLTAYSLRESVSEIAEFLARGKDSVEVHCQDQSLFRQLFKVRAQFYVDVPITQLRGALESVKTTLIEWSLKLEADGIVGEGLKFSESEKSKAITSEDKLTPQVIINIIGQAENSLFQQGSPGASQVRSE